MNLLPIFAEKIATILLILAIPFAASAQTWDELSQQQQEILKPFESSWAELNPEKRSRMLRGAERWKDMSPAQRKKMKQAAKESDSD